MSLCINDRQRLEKSIIADQFGVIFIKTHSNRYTVVLPVTCDDRLGASARVQFHVERRRVSAVRQFEKPHCGVEDIACRVGISRLHAFFVRIEAFNDMVILIRFAGLPVRHPESNGDLGRCLCVRRAQRILSVVTENRLVRIPFSENGLQSVFRFLTVIRCRDHPVTLSGRTRSM